jgi:hypothetical protein
VIRGGWRLKIWDFGNLLLFRRFRSCLKMARTLISESVGNIYFNLVDVPCFVFIEQKV